MTEQEMQQLSHDVAAKYGIAIPINYAPEANVKLGMTERWGKAEHGDDLILGWLHEDSARCFDLMVEHEIDLSHQGQYKVVKCWPDRKIGQTFGDWYNGAMSKMSNVLDHNNDKHLATRIAILKALLAKD